MSVPSVRILIKFMTRLLSVQFYFVAVYTINPLLSPPGGLFISNTFKGGGLIETGWLILQNDGICSPPRTVIYKVEKLKYKKLLIMQPRVKNRSKLPVGE